MIPKEKAKELINRFEDVGMDIKPAKQCALICVDEIKNELIDNGMDDDIDWWDKVEQEISNR